MTEYDRGQFNICRSGNSAASAAFFSTFSRPFLYVFLKLDLKVKRQYFRYKEYINWLLIDEILTYVFNYGGPSSSFLRYEPLKNDVTIFDPFSGLETRFRHFPTPGDYLFVKI